MTTVTPPTTPPAQVEAPQKASRRRIPVRFIVFGVLVLLVGVAFVWLLSWYSPVPVREVTVTGAGPEKQSEVIAAAGITDGTAIRNIDAAAVTERVAAVPGIESVEVVLQRPFTIDLQVSQRFPFAVMAVGDAWVVLDEQGQAISEGAVRPPGLPQVGSLDGASVVPGVVAVAALPPEVRRSVKDVAVTKTGDVVIQLTGGVTIDWGATGQDELKGLTVAQLLQYKPKQINVSVPQRPALSGELTVPKQNRPRVETTTP